jgi:hypothetical protein
VATSSSWSQPPRSAQPSSATWAIHAGSPSRRRPPRCGGIERIRGTTSDSALDTLLLRGLVAFDQHHLLVTTRTFLEFAGLRDLADLPALRDVDVDAEEVRRDLLKAG